LHFVTERVKTIVAIAHDTIWWPTWWQFILL